MDDKEQFFRKLIEATRSALRLPPLGVEKVDAALKQLLSARETDALWATVQQIGPDSYLQQFRTVARTAADNGGSTLSWVDRIDREVRAASKHLKNPLVLGASILGIHLTFKALSRLIDDRHHHHAAGIEKDVTRALESTALTGNVPFLMLASAGDRMIEGTQRRNSQPVRHHEPHARETTASHSDRARQKEEERGPNER